MTTNEQLLLEYCGLTHGQFIDLADAWLGVLNSMNGARRQVMNELVGPDLRITQAGQRMYERASNVIDRNFDGSPDIIATFQDTARAARLINKQFSDQVRGKKMTSADVKLLVMVGRQPGLSMRYLTGVFGHTTINQMIEYGLVRRKAFEGSSTEWAWFTLPIKMIHLIEDLNAALGAK